MSAKPPWPTGLRPKPGMQIKSRCPPHPPTPPCTRRQPVSISCRLAHTALTRSWMQATSHRAAPSLRQEAAHLPSCVQAHGSAGPGPGAGLGLGLTGPAAGRGLGLGAGLGLDPPAGSAVCTAAGDGSGDGDGDGDGAGDGNGVGEGPAALGVQPKATTRGCSTSCDGTPCGEGGVEGRGGGAAADGDPRGRPRRPPPPAHRLPTGRPRLASMWCCTAGCFGHSYI